MASKYDEEQCFDCGNENNTYKCKGCLQEYCLKHLNDHRQTLDKRFNEIENDCNQFLQILNQHKNNPEKYQLIQQIDKWKDDSIEKIKHTADECKQIIYQHETKYIPIIENKFIHFTKQLAQIRKSEFNEIDLNKLKEKLQKLVEQLDKTSNISIQQISSSFINKIFVISSFDRKWNQLGITIAGGNGEGKGLNQLSNPRGIFIDTNQTIYIADCYNHRIVSWRYNENIGEIIAGGNVKGNQINQLCGPVHVCINKKNNSFIISDNWNRRVMEWFRQDNKNGKIIIENIDCYGLTIDCDGYLYISDCKKDEVRKWKIGETYGTIVAGGNGKGDQLNQLNTPTYIFIDEDYSLYVSDSENHRIMKWIKDAKEGIVVAGGNGQGNSLSQLSDPRGIFVDQLNHIYVADSLNNRVMRWLEGDKEGTIIIGESQLNCPISLSFDRENNLYVADRCNHRIQKFQIELNKIF